MIIIANRILSMVTGYSIEIQKIRPSETNREQNVDASMLVTLAILCGL